MNKYQSCNYSVFHRMRYFAAPSYWAWFFSNTDDIGLILFPDMGDFVPKRNFSQKSVESPAKSPTTQMSKFVDICNMWSKFKKKYHSFTKLGENLCFLEKCCVQWILQILRFSKMSLMYSLTHLELISSEYWEWCYGKIMWFENILDFDIWLVGDFVGLSIDFWSKFLLGTKSPMSGKRMSHRLSVIEKIQSQ